MVGCTWIGFGNPVATWLVSVVRLVRLEVSQYVVVLLVATSSANSAAAPGAPDSSLRPSTSCRSAKQPPDEEAQSCFVSAIIIP
jgi:hypothetical protein